MQAAGTNRREMTLELAAVRAGMRFKDVAEQVGLVIGALEMRMARAVVIVDGNGPEEVRILDSQHDRLFTVARGEQGCVQSTARPLTSVDRDEFHSRPKA